MNPPSHQFQIGKIAARAHPVFVRYGWKWKDSGVPTEGEIASELTRIILEAEDSTRTVRFGRLRVDFDRDDESNHLDGVYVSLELGRLD